MHDREGHLALARRADQPVLGCLQRPARAGEAALLVRVRIADHYGLPVAAGREMTPVGGFGAQAAQELARTLQRLDRLEQRRHLETAFAAVLVRDSGPAGEQQYRQHVIGSLGAAHDIGADGAGAVLVACVPDGVEHRERAAARGVQRRRWAPDRARAARAGVRGALRAGSDGQSGMREALADHGVMSARALGHVQRRDVKAESAHSPDEAPHQEIAGMPAAIVGEAVGRELDVREQFIGALIRVRDVPRRSPSSRSPIWPK